LMFSGSRSMPPNAFAGFEPAHRGFETYSHGARATSSQCWPRRINANDPLRKSVVPPPRLISMRVTACDVDFAATGFFCSPNDCQRLAGFKLWKKTRAPRPAEAPGWRNQPLL